MNAAKDAPKTENLSSGFMVYDDPSREAFLTAHKLKGQNGRVATAPEVVDAKILAGDEDPIWHTYISTTTAEYFGSSKGGVPILIVGHNVGPFADVERVRDGKIKQGRLQLSRGEFRQLESGVYGPVKVLDIQHEICPFDSHESVNPVEAFRIRLLRARLGPRVKEFLQRHLDLSMRYMTEVSIGRDIDDCVVTNQHDFSYRFKEGRGIERDYDKIMFLPSSSADSDLLQAGYWGHLVTLGTPTVSGHWHDRKTRSGVISEIGSQKLSDAGRFIVVSGQGQLGKVTKGLEEILGDRAKHLDLLMVPADSSKKRATPYTLTRIGGDWFTQYRDEDDVMPSGGECKVTSIEKIPGPQTFRTEILGYHGFFKYELDTVRKLMPADANAFYMGEPHNIFEDGDPKWQEAPIEFYRVEVDAAKRLLTRDEARKDSERILKAAGML